MPDVDFDVNAFHIPRWNELPNIDLYMDQVLNYIENYLKDYIKIESNEKFITKTMINNYVKQELLEPPIKKKYKKEHIAYLFVICILKQVYSISDINELIKVALKDNTVEEAYDKFCVALEKAIYATFGEKRYEESENMTEERYLLKNVTQSFANKLYVEKKFLHK